MDYKRQIILEIKGNCIVKKNQYKYTRKGGKSWGYKPKNVVDYIDSALLQLEVQIRKYQKTSLPIYGDVAVYLWFDIMGKDKDIDGMTTTIYDILQKAEVIKNDNQITDDGHHKERNQPEDVVRILIQEL